MNTNEGCKGCRGFNERCMIKFYKPIIEKCSCRICLIKGMCNGRCTDRRGLYATIPKKERVNVLKKFRASKAYGGF